MDQRLAPDWTIDEPELDDVASCALCGMRTTVSDVLELHACGGEPEEAAICEECAARRGEANGYGGGGDRGYTMTTLREENELAALAGRVARIEDRLGRDDWRREKLYAVILGLALLVGFALFCAIDAASSVQQLEAESAARNPLLWGQ